MRRSQAAKPAGAPKAQGSTAPLIAQNNHRCRQLRAEVFKRCRIRSDMLLRNHNTRTLKWTATSRALYIKVTFPNAWRVEESPARWRTLIQCQRPFVRRPIGDRRPRGRRGGGSILNVADKPNLYPVTHCTAYRTTPCVVSPTVTQAAACWPARRS